MIRATLVSLLAVTAMAQVPAHAAEPDENLQSLPQVAATALTATTKEGQYRSIFAALDQQRWADAKGQIATLESKDPLRAFATAELYLAKNSPRVELFDLLALINTASWLPQAEQLSRLAQKRGAQILPALPQVQKLVWLGAAPRREYLATVKTDTVAQALGTKVLPLIKADNPAGAELEITAVEPMLTPQGRTEWRQRVAWSYYIENDDANARRLATQALSDNIGGDWAVQAHWTIGLAAWRQDDCRTSGASFANVAALAGNADMRAAGAYWAARAYMNCGDPARVAGLLKTAAKADETFYGLLARETLGMTPRAPALALVPEKDGLPPALKDIPNAQLAIALSGIGRMTQADMVLRHQARIGGSAQYDALLRLAGSANLPTTQLWLAHNGPNGKQPGSFARYPAPAWKPDGGWRVDPSLVFAHTLQESGFRADAVSSAGARGLMQVRPGTAGDVAGGSVSMAQLHMPSTNMEYGQRYLEQLRDMPETGGLLPKVMAAYNAGPTPVGRWKYEVKDGGDPLLFIESVPYYETRAYVNIVMRNYWMYQLQAKGVADCMTGMAQGLWPRFPGTKGLSMVRISANGKASSAN